ncbi:hypothetical protein C7460_1231 [Marinoscillum furvescens DSM 4134]|uniref:Uncharacterized protein n=1 Tax=Marinoscillum furvescens DSM 4134 TaxID=1122208 RepID=A0A3D9KZW6_MARFU|nr:hypothetical protein C7460_1231 [Marinoscillum furvescens DSM 4134]
MKYTLILVFSCFLLNKECFSQKCERLDRVFVELNSLDTTLVVNCLNNIETRIFLADSSEIFMRKSGLELIENDEYYLIHFKSVEQLRKKAIEIRKCEVQQSNNSVFLDPSINSIFKNIYMVARSKECIYRFRVVWVDGIE